MNTNFYLCKQAEILKFMGLVLQSGNSIRTSLELCIYQYPEYELELLELDKTLVENNGNHKDISQIDEELVLDLYKNLNIYKNSFPEGFLKMLGEGLSKGTIDKDLDKFSSNILEKAGFKIPSEFKESKEILFYKNFYQNMGAYTNYARKNHQKKFNPEGKSLKELILIQMKQTLEKIEIEKKECNRLEFIIESKKIKALTAKNVAVLEYPSKEIYDDLIKMVKKEDSISNALCTYSKFFPEYQVQIMETAEKYDMYDYVIPKLVDFLRLKKAISEKFK